jgi:hypothetical protein
MKIVALIEFLQKHLKTVVRLSWLALALLVLADWLLVNKEHAHTAPEHWFGFWSGFGFVACVVLNLGAKWFGHLGIMQPEDYYGDE